MNKEALKIEINNMFPLKYDGDYIKSLEAIFNRYIALVEEIGDVCSPIDEIKLLCEELLQVLSLYYDGRRGEAFNVFCQIMNGKTEGENLFSKIGSVDIETDKYFFRARERKFGEEFSVKDMFHIPLNKRGIVRTQRYSYPGYPCLYLGNSLYSCYEEMRRIPFDNLMFSAYKVKRAFKVYDMRIPSDVDYEDSENLQNTLRRLPLVFACNVVVKNSEDIFKPEYIIPQMLLETIIYNNRKTTEKGMNILDLNVIWGVIYTSTHINNDFPYGKDYLQNIVLPIINSNDSQNYCQYLAALFYISKPLCYEYESLKDNTSNILIEDVGEDALKIQIKNQYAGSKMGYLEEKLKSIECKSLPHCVANIPNNRTIELDWQGNPVPFEILSDDAWSIG